MAKTRVVFVHRPGQVNFGSKIMRCDQLSQIAAQHLNDTYSFDVLTPPRRRFAVRQRRFAKGLQGAIVIFLKGTARVFDPNALDILRKSVRGLCIDHLDAPIGEEFLDLADVHIAASRRGETLLRQKIASMSSLRSTPVVAHLGHHADPRLSPARRDRKDINIGYFGNRANTYLPPTVSQKVVAYEYGKDVEFSSVLSQMQETQMHYAVRGPTARPAVENRIAKPFTKGFNAAAVGANVLVNRQVDDAEFYLGNDYPFLINGLDQNSLREGVEKAQDLYRSPDWQRGLDIMKDVRERCSARAIAQELDDVLSTFS